ncbi:FxsA family protein [Acinetobacter sp. MD2(2019)]|uniref:FxsA family protein n=1 Tax=Acinetobacter sp. MD2(2019) TaxID=2605273 RepID=UPI002D1F308F|nr:FxsA family protein [Acinetobacter sp. MD2(2019)]MEB3753776.1 FxsA family protein [Acinetobacter sp. MD2(2019)]
MNVVLMVVIGAILEIAVWIGVAQFISGWYVFFWFILAAVIGFKLLRSSTATIMPQLQQMQMTGQLSADKTVTQKIALAIAGILLIIPGLISDVIAVLILLPPVQKMVVAALMSALAKRQQAMMGKMMGGMGMGGANFGGQNPFEDLMRQMQGQQTSANDSDIIEGEAREVKPNHKKIELKDVKKN